MKAKQDIVPVVLANDSKAPTNQIYKSMALCFYTKDLKMAV
ncbi:hypothetical protein [Carnobacterium sp. TMP28]